MKKYIRDYAFLLSLAGFIILLDQLTKSAVRTNLAFSEMWSPWEWAEPYFRIVNWRNSGAAFGMLQGFGGIFSILSIIVALVIVYYFPQVPSKDWPLRVAMGMQLGGAVGNLIDRIQFNGNVTDFISVGNFPVFNVADASITVGVAILILGMWVKEHEEKKLSGLDDIRDGTTANTDNELVSIGNHPDVLASEKLLDD